MNNRMIQITDAKVRGFWADSKKMARFLSELLRQWEDIVTEWRKWVRFCRREEISRLRSR